MSFYHKENTLQKLIVGALAAAMLLSLLPMSALADAGAPALTPELTESSTEPSTVPADTPLPEETETPSSAPQIPEETGMPSEPSVEGEKSDSQTPPASAPAASQNGAAAVDEPGTESDPTTPNGAFGPKWDGAENNSNQYWITIWVDTDGDGEPETPFVPDDPNAPELADGVAVKAKINWQLHDSTTAFELNLGDLSKLGGFNLDGTYIYADAAGHAYKLTFTQNSDGEIIAHVEYQDDCSCTGRNIEISFEGNLDLDPRDDNEGGDNHFKIGDQDIPYTPDYSDSGLDVKKTYGVLELGDDGEFYLTYTVENTVHGKVTNPVFHDDLPEGVTLVEESVEVTFVPREEFTYDPDPADSGNWTVKNPDSEHSFGIASANGMTLYTGDVVTYTYKVKVDKTTLGSLLTSNKQLENTALAECGEKGQGKSTAAYPGTNFRKPQIEKTGTTEGGQEIGNEITWTITWDPKGLGDMLKEAIGSELIQEHDGDVLAALVAKLGEDKAKELLESLGIGYTITDEVVGNNHEFDGADKTKFEFSIFDMKYDAATGTYTKKVTTTITGDVGDDGWQNTGVGAGADKSTGKVEKDLPYNYLKSYVADRNTDKLQQTWEITVTNPQVGAASGLLHGNKLDMTFTDTLPDETVYVEGSAYVTLSTSSSNFDPEKDMPGWATAEKRQAFYALLSEALTVTDNGDGTITVLYSVLAEGGEMARFRNSVLNFDFGDGAHTGKDYLELTDWNFAIRYDTRVPDGNAFDRLVQSSSGSGSSDNDRITFKNTVQGTINGVEGTERDASTTTTFRQSLQKSNVYTGDVATGDAKYKFSKQPVDQFLNNTGNGYQSIYFEILVNQDKMSFTDDGRLILVDNMGEDLSIIPWSIQVVEVRGSANGNELTIVGEPFTSGEQTDTGFAYTIDSKNNRITFNVPDSKYLVISYWANVLDDGDGIFEASNSIEIYGWESMSRNESEAPDSPLYPSASASSGNAGFSVYKFGYDENGQEVPLDGAAFELEQLTYHPENEPGNEFTLDSSSTPSEWDGMQRTYTDNGETKTVTGVFDFTNLPKGAIFRLTETATPDGHVTSEPIYFIFENYDENIAYTNNTVSSDVLLALTDYNIQVFSYYEMIRVFNRAKSTETSFSGNKDVTGRTWDSTIDDGAYTFRLTAVGDAPMPDNAETDANGNRSVTVNDMHGIGFPAITYTKAGTYYYTIEEIEQEPLVPGITYDKTAYEVEVIVKEEPSSGQIYVESVYYTIKDGDGRKMDSFEFINEYYAPGTGSLTVSKAVTGTGSRNKLFHFTVTLSGTYTDASGTHDASELNGTYGNMTFVNGVASFDLKHGESRNADGLPAGIEYTVTETGNEGYTATILGDYTDSTGKGTIPEENTASAEFTNTRNVHDLTVMKTVTGSAGETDREFSFTVTLTGVAADGTKAEDIDGTYGDMHFENGVASFTLKHGESKTAVNLPEGISYEVKEADYSQDGYSTRAEGSTKGTLTADAAVRFVNTSPAETTPPTEEPTTPPTTEPTPTPSPSPAPSAGAKTGDGSRPGLWALLLTASFLCMTACAVAYRKSLFTGRKKQ